MEATEAAVATDGDLAERTLARLLSLDATHAARQELLAAGVPETTAFSLYPATFEAIAPGLIDHLRARAAGSAAVSRHEIGGLTRVLLPVLRAEPQRSAYRERFAETQASAPWLEPLAAAIETVSGDELLHRVEANALVEILWYTWHFTVEPVELSAGERQAVRWVLARYGEQLFGLGRA